MMLGEDWGSAEFRAGFRLGETTILERIYWSHVAAIDRLLAHGFSTRSNSAVIRGPQTRRERRDLLHEVFVRAFSASARAAFDGTRSFAPYLYSIARHVLVDWHRRAGREIPTDEVELHHVPAESESEPPHWTNPVTVRLVEEFVRSLGEPLRELHRLRYVLGRPQEEVATALGISRQTVRTLEARLKSDLRQALRQAGHIKPEPDIIPLTPRQPSVPASAPTSYRHRENRR